MRFGSTMRKVCVGKRNDNSPTAMGTMCCRVSKQGVVFGGDTLIND